MRWGYTKEKALGHWQKVRYGRIPTGFIFRMKVVSKDE